MRTIDCPETSVQNFHYSLRNNPEERSSLIKIISLFLFTSRLLFHNLLLSLILKEAPFCGEFEANACSRKSHAQAHKHTVSSEA